MLIKYGDAEPVKVIETIDIDDESTKKKMSDLKSEVANKESLDFVLSNIPEENK